MRGSSHVPKGGCGLLVLGAFGRRSCGGSRAGRGDVRILRRRIDPAHPRASKQRKARCDGIKGPFRILRDTADNQLNPQIIWEIRDGPTYSIYPEEVEVICQIPSGTIDRNEYPTVGGSSSRGESANCRTNEGTTANERTEKRQCRARKRKRRKCTQPQVEVHGTLRKRQWRAVFLSQRERRSGTMLSCTLVNRS